MLVRFAQFASCRVRLPWMRMHVDAIVRTSHGYTRDRTRRSRVPVDLRNRFRARLPEDRQISYTEITEEYSRVTRCIQ